MKDKHYCIKVIGVGGCGCNTVSSIEKKWRNSDRSEISFEFYGVDTDFVSLARQEVSNKVEIGRTGTGTGKKPEVGAQAAKESAEPLKGVLMDADIVVLCAGLGGGTGSGATGVIAQMVRSGGSAALLAVTTLPFSYEDSRRQEAASKALEDIREMVPCVFPVRSGEGLEDNDSITYLEARRMTDRTSELLLEMLYIITCQVGDPNLDFEEFRELTSQQGNAMLCYGEAGNDEPLSGILGTALASQTGVAGSCDLRRAKMAAFIVVSDNSLVHRDLHSAKNNLDSELQRGAQVFDGVYMGPAVTRRKVFLLAVGMEEEEALPPTEPATDGVEGEQFSFGFLSPEKGRFANTQPTYIEGTNYDSPTYKRQNGRLVGK